MKHDPTSNVTFLDDIYYFERDPNHPVRKARLVTKEQWMEFTKIERKTSMLPGFILFCLGALIVYMWESGISFREMFALAFMTFVMFFLPVIAYLGERK